MPDYPLVLERLLNTPLLAHPEKAEIVAAVVLRRQGVSVTVAAHAEFVEAPKAGPLQERRLLERAGDTPYLFDPSTGIAVIGIQGSLAHRQGYIGRSSGVMGYDGISAQFDAAVASTAVRAVILDFHTAGGEVHGAFQLADRIAAARGKKRLVAMVDEMAYSAGYLLAAACDEIWLASDTAGVGSIGVVVVHLSFEKMLAAEGVKPTIIVDGDYKADGNPYEDLPADARARIQAKVDFVGAEFRTRVAAWRRLKPEAVAAMKASTFLGPAALAARLADGIADPMDVFDALAAELGAPRTPLFTV